MISSNIWYRCRYIDHFLAAISSIGRLLARDRQFEMGVSNADAASLLPHLVIEQTRGPFLAEVRMACDFVVVGDGVNALDADGDREHSQRLQHEVPRPHTVKVLR